MDNRLKAYFRILHELSMSTECRQTTKILNVLLFFGEKGVSAPHNYADDILLSVFTRHY